jgi:hypothetical protein
MQSETDSYPEFIIPGLCSTLNWFLNLNRSIYFKRDECEKQVKGFSNAKYKKFKTKEEALVFIGDTNNSNMPDDKVLGN